MTKKSSLSSCLLLHSFLYCNQQLVDVANKLGPALQVGENLVWEGSDTGQSSRAGSRDPSAPESVASSSSSFQEDGSFV